MSTSNLIYLSTLKCKLTFSTGSIKTGSGVTGLVYNISLNAP